ncbi:hypothetical protein D3C87_207960 [compost metagenome]
MGVGIAGVAIPASAYFLSSTVKEYAVLLIKREFDYLKLEEGSVEKYVNDYFQYPSNNLMEKLKWKAVYYLNISPDKADSFFELLKYYLLSSDFFINKTDETKIVRYLGLYSPYKSPVPNPYSFVLYPPDEIREA